MSSRSVEDRHVVNLEKLLAASELECIRLPPEELMEEVEVEVEEIVPEEEQQQPLVQELIAEEEYVEEFIEEAEKIEAPFPSPSLRHVLTDKVRNIQVENTIHVLPAEFKTTIEPEDIPRIATTAPQKYIDIIAGLVGCTEYKSSLAEYWFLDALANLLRRAQEDNLDKATQAVLMLWFCEWIKEIQHFDAADRLRMMMRFKVVPWILVVEVQINANFRSDDAAQAHTRDTMLSAARFIDSDGHIPTPAECGVYYRAREGEPRDSRIAKGVLSTGRKKTAASEVTSLSSRKDGQNFSKTEVMVTFEKKGYDCALNDLAKIIHYIFDMFSTDYQYKLVRSIFTSPPGYTVIDAPCQLRTPKKMYAQLKPKKDKSPSKDKKDKDKGKKVKGKVAAEEPTKEYLALMELKAREERDLEEKEELEREDWNRRSHILPLQMAVPDDYMDKYWPPPEPEPEPVVLSPEPKAKPKKGKK